MRRPRTSFDRRVVWLLGSPRSGSTWLLYLLAGHERVVPINEPNIGTLLGPFMSDLPGMTTEGLDLDTFTLRRAQAAKSPAFFADEFADVWVPALGRLMRERFEAHVRRRPPAAGARRALVVVKEPNGSQSADVLLRAMPESRLLFLLRDGRDVVDSELAANLRGSWVAGQFSGSHGVDDDRLAFVRQSAMKWLWRTEVVEQAFAAHSGPKLLVRYEDLRADPRPGLRQVFDWLELAISDEDLAALEAEHAFEAVPEEERGAQSFHRSATPGGWRENLRPEEQEAVEAAIG